LVGTPIGNLGDASPRMRRTIEAADVIAAEDTRRFLSLAQRLELRDTNRVISVFDHNEGHRAPELVDLIAAGETVVLLSDAGMPAVSDPGHRVGRAGGEAGAASTARTGPAAGGRCLAAAGRPTARGGRGSRVVRACAAAGLAIPSTPGPSAVLMALAVSGLPSDRFSFEGFLPRRSGQRRTLLEELRAEKRTMVFFESPHRIADTM